MSPDINPNTEKDKLCTPCLEQNLIEAGISVFTCSRCSEQFCVHSASKLDPQFCTYCCNDFQLTDTIETAERPIINPANVATPVNNGEALAVKKFRVRHLTLGGKHWLFANRAIATLSDEELGLAIEYHNSMYHGMIFEREGRFVKKIQRNKGKIVGNEQNSLLGSVASPFVVTPDGVRFVTATVQKQRKSRVAKARADKAQLAFDAQQQINGINNSNSTASYNSGPVGVSGVVSAKVEEWIKTLLKAGLTPEQIKSLGKKA